jgi:serine protease Do
MPGKQYFYMKNELLPIFGQMGGIYLKKETQKGFLYFIIFFCLGWGMFIYSERVLAPSQPIVKKEELPALGRVSEAARAVSASVVGITNLSGSGDVWGQRNVETTGSGVIIDSDGYIVTNNHVVKGADRLIVTLADGGEEEAKIIGTDPRCDLALIKIDVDRFVTPVTFGDSDLLQVGQEVVAIGNPLGLRFARSVTAGVVSGLNRLLTTEEGFAFRLVQTDAAINPGNSGGALVNLEGELIGINTIKIAMEGFEGMGFSIPSNQVQKFISDIKKYCKVKRPIMGIRIIGEITEDQAAYYKLPHTCGVSIETIAKGPADKAGLKNFDIITEVDGEKVETGLDLQEKIQSKKAGQKVTVKVLRLPRTRLGEVQTRTFEIVLAE